MGWSGTTRLLWGDAPQDVMDAALRRRAPRFDSDRAPREKRVALARKFLADKALRARVNKTYLEEVGRPMNESEYRNLVKVTTNLGGRTLYFGAVRKKRKATKRR